LKVCRLIPHPSAVPGGGIFCREREKARNDRGEETENVERRRGYGGAKTPPAEVLPGVRCFG